MKCEEADVVIIGAGINGCSIAYELAKKSQSVIVLERGRAAEEASARSGGGVRQSNRDPAELPLAMEAVKIWADMKEALDWDVEYSQTGNLRLTRTPEEYDKFHENFERDRSMGLDVRFLSAEQTRALAPALSRELNFFGATFCPTDGAANPLLVTKAIARAARRLGVHIREHEPLERLEVKSRRVTAAITARAEYRAPVFVNSAGPWARPICNQIGLDFPVTIKRSQILVTEPLPPLIKQFISADVGYMRQALNGGIHLGIRSAPVENYDKSMTIQAFMEVGTGYVELFPFLKRVNIIHGWAGITHWTPDALPIIDKAPNLEGLFLTAGFSGHGFCLGPIIGKLMAEWIIDGKPSLDLHAFHWTRFEDIYEGQNTRC